MKTPLTGKTGQGSFTFKPFIKKQNGVIINIDFF
jgi:hypothetical protein